MLNFYKLKGKIYNENLIINDKCFLFYKIKGKLTKKNIILLFIFAIYYLLIYIYI